MKFLDKLHIWETNYGRDAGWLMSYRGEAVALLTDPQWEDMFWMSYRLTYLPNETVNTQQFYRDEFWNHEACHDATWQNAYFNLAPTHPLAGRPPQRPGDRISMRGLYLNIPAPGFLARQILRYRSHRGLTWRPPPRPDVRWEHESS